MTARLRIAWRLARALGWLVLCVAQYGTAFLVGRHERVPRKFLAGMLRIVGGRLAVVGELAPGRRFLLANHVSWIDIFALAQATGTAFVAHDGLAQFGPLNWLCRLNRTVFVSRSDRAGVAGQVAQVQNALFTSTTLTIFPEGTTSNGTTLLPFKSSLLAVASQADSDIAVQPVWIDYGPDAAQVAWTGAEPGLTNAFRVLSRKRPFAVTVHLLPPLTAEQMADRKTIAMAAQRAISEQMR